MIINGISAQITLSQRHIIAQHHYELNQSINRSIVLYTVSDRHRRLS